MEVFKSKLSSGGELVVTEDRWYISYYFPGPDLRYNGTYFRIESADIDQYIEAWQNNFRKYLKYKNVTKISHASYKLNGEAGMAICVGGSMEGVCIDGWHMHVSTQDKINRIISDYKLCKTKAKIAQDMLKRKKQEHIGR